MQIARAIKLMVDSWIIEDCFGINMAQASGLSGKRKKEKEREREREREKEREGEKETQMLCIPQSLNPQ